MAVRAAINGFGRIGRNILRALYEENYRDSIQIVALNDLGDAAINTHLFKYDTVHGRFGGDVRQGQDSLIVNGDEITITAEKDPTKLPWQKIGVDVVFECTGHFTSREKAAAHLDAGAKKVIVSAPSKHADATIVYGVNHDSLKQEHQVISCASCTTNCLAPIAKALNDSLGIESGLMTTIHAYTNDQKLIDVYHSDAYRARSATHSMIPTKTGAATSIGLVVPELAGRLEGMAIRVPTINVSLVDLTIHASRDTTAAEVNEILKRMTEACGVVAYNEEKLVSVDFNHSSCSGIVDANHTRVIGRQVKVMAWYDNEWGFSNRMLDTTNVWLAH